MLKIVNPATQQLISELPEDTADSVKAKVLAARAAQPAWWRTPIEARKGAIELTPGAARGLRLRDMPGVPIQGTLPLVGRVAAGSPILAAEHIEAQYRIDAALFAPRADYLLRVKGASMQEIGILDGDLLVVHKTDDARSGQIVVARLGEEVTVKRLKRRGREITLVAENTAFAPIVVDPAKTSFAIEGVAVGVIRPSRAL